LAVNLTAIFNVSIAEGRFPGAWQEANIRPVYKSKGSHDDPNSFRPISILPIFARIFEKLAARQLLFYCDSHDLIPVEQFGFRRYSSCETALLSAVDTWRGAIDNNEFTGVLLLDISKAFDSIPHNTLLSELQTINCSSNTTRWFSSYLNNRYQRVLTNDGSTPWKPVSRGVPQGSCLSPLLFNIVMRDLPRSTSCSTIQFADDVTLSASSNSFDTLKQKLIASYLEVKQFCESKGLTINASKTQFIIIKSSNKRLLAPGEITIDGHTISAQPTVKLLGVTIDRHLTFKDHVQGVTAKCRGLLSLLRRGAPVLPAILLRLAYIALIRSHLEFCSGLLLSIAKTHQLKLETVQKIAARIICNAPRDAHAAPLLERLSLESLLARRTTHACQLVSDCLRGHCHPALKNWFTLNGDGGVTQSTNVPKTAAGRKQFSFTAAALYNDQLS
jgi:hypothetical protein